MPRGGVESLDVRVGSEVDVPDVAAENDVPEEAVLLELGRAVAERVARPLVTLCYL
jgi:hypothetical protein